MTAVVRRLLLSATALLLLAAAPADAFRLGRALEPLARNPVDALRELPLDPIRYDRATHCARRDRPGMVAFARWLDAHAAGVSWGVYRCERWSGRSASLHAESRALDWHLDVGRPADREEARRVIELLLAPDRTGNPQALATRMGMQEIIWDCSYWSAGAPEFRAYAPCEPERGRRGRARPVKVDRTTAHRDHIHFGLSKPGAAGRTSFWSQQRG